jgi:predicted TIM-barrel fold metal-dependent hydrolase
MIVDVCAHVGPFTRRPAGRGAGELGRLLAPYGVTRVYAGRLSALWYENPHDANREPLMPAGEETPSGVTFVAVPVLDPTIATWREELDRLKRSGPLPMVRLHPNYGGYTLAAADPLLAELARRKVVAQVIVRLDDPRRQHPRAQVADVPAADVLEAAVRHPELPVLLTGALGPALQILANRLPAAGNLWADTSQADGVDTVADLMQTPWRDRLVFGSHAPLFIPYAALARVVLDLDDAAAGRVLGDNAVHLFGL